MKTLTAIIYPGQTGRWLVAFNPETGTTTQGKTVEQALQNLKEAVALCLEERRARVRPVFLAGDANGFGPVAGLRFRPARAGQGFCLRKHTGWPVAYSRLS